MIVKMGVATLENDRLWFLLAMQDEFMNLLA